MTDRTRPVDVVRSLVFYLVFYVGSIVPVIGALLAMPLGARIFRAVVESWAGYHCWCARVLLGIHIRVEGVIPQGGVLVAVRHESFFEAIDLPRLLPRPVVFAKAALLRIPLWGRAAGRYGVIAVERSEGARALRAMITSARTWSGEGRPLAIFPEGTRVPIGTAPPLQAGFAGLYKLLGLPVVPVAVDSGRLYQRRWKRAGTITYRFGETIPPGLSRDAIELRVRTAINALNIQNNLSQSST